MGLVVTALVKMLGKSILESEDDSLTLIPFPLGFSDSSSSSLLLGILECSAFNVPILLGFIDRSASFLIVFEEVIARPKVLLIEGMEGASQVGFATVSGVVVGLGGQSPFITCSLSSSPDWATKKMTEANNHRG